VDKKIETARKFANDAMALMAKAQVEPTPENYQLFYRLAAGEAPGMKEFMTGFLAAKQPMSPATLDGLRERFVGTRQADAAIAELGAGMSTALNAVLSRIETAERDAVAYGRTLSEASGELGGDQSPDALRKLVSGLLAATQEMESRTKDLEAELQKSSDEVEDLKAKLDDVRKESLTDQLTGIANRKAFDIELAKAIAQSRRSGEPMCLFMCDIDRFKMFNDTWGHQTGDQVLRLVANCLSDNVKGRDTAARYGGEEFSVILPQTALADAVTLANTIRTRVESRRLTKKSSGEDLGTMTISIGVAQLTAGDAAASLVQRADACLYAAKNAGRNLVMAESGASAATLAA
jgi:diguanylate cyclase